MHFNGRLREAARLAYHEEYGAYYPACIRSGKKLLAMNLTQEERVKVNKIVVWMLQQIAEKDRWF